jgi:spermidine/putrescine ABC transporter ATP-binding subunit
VKGAIALRGLTKIYGTETVVDAVSVEIAPGEFFSLLGPSGSGKTTTLMMIAGFVEPASGTIELDGADLTRRPPQARGLGMVFQNYALFPHLDVFENIAFPLRARRLGETEIRSRVQRGLEVVRLEGYERRMPKQLSGGQQQRVALARAVVFDPQVVLMDEPLGALDKNLRYQMQVEIKEIQQRLGMTVVYVTHDQEEAMNMSDRIALMNRGRIEQVGNPRDVYERPETVFAATFLGEANLIPGTLVAGRLRVANGAVLAGTPASPLAEGGQAALFVRPEKLLLSGDGPGENRLDGVVRRVSFLGNVIRYGLEIGQGSLLTVDVQNASGRRSLDAGEPATVSWRAADSRLLAS